MSTKKTITAEDKIVAHNIKTYRKSQNITQSALADHLNVSFQQVQKYENGVNRVSASTLLKISEYLNIPPATLLAQETDQQNSSDLNNKDTMELLTIYRQIKDENVKNELKNILKSYVKKNEES